MRLLKVFALLGLLTTLYFLGDSLRFYQTCRQFGEEAKRGLSQLPAHSPDDEVIVVLTGDRSRIPRAMELLDTRLSARLIISGVRPGTKLEELMNVQGGTIGSLPKIWPRILIESTSTSTIENAVETAKLLAAQPTEHLVLVSSDYHLQRALAIFRRWLPTVEIIPYAVASEVTQVNFTTLPSAFGKFFWEYWKYVAYRLEIF